MAAKKSDTLTYVLVGLGIIALGTFIVYKLKNRGGKASKNAFRKDLVKIAEDEHKHWDSGRLKETATGMYDRLKSYWSNIGWGEHKWTPSSVAWSAAFISYVMKKANAGSNFKYSASHSKYIRDAVKNRKENNSNPFKAYKLNEKKVEVGDLVCYSRQSGVNYDTTNSYKSHCDIVVNVDNNQAEVIGGNVGHTVGKKTVQLKDGKVADNKNDWFTIIKTT